mgnify:FL=1
MLPRPRSIFDDAPPRASTGVIYDPQMANAPARAAAINVGGVVFMPDEPLAERVNALYSRIKRQLYSESDAAQVMRIGGSNYHAFNLVSKSLRENPDLRVADYVIRARLSYTQAQNQGEVSVTHVRMTAMKDGHSGVMPVRFVNLHGSLAKDVFMPTD